MVHQRPGVPVQVLSIISSSCGEEAPELERVLGGLSEKRTDLLGAEAGGPSAQDGLMRLRGVLCGSERLREPREWPQKLLPVPRRGEFCRPRWPSARGEEAAGTISGNALLECSMALGGGDSQKGSGVGGPLGGGDMAGEAGRLLGVRLERCGGEVGGARARLSLAGCPSISRKCLYICMQCQACAPFYQSVLSNYNTDHGHNL